MKANEFVKKFGWEVARFCILNCACPDDRWFIHHGALIDGEDFDDLKRLVVSHELVEKLGGIAKTKEAFGLCVFRNRASYAKRVEQAIADVESCMGVASGSN